MNSTTLKIFLSFLVIFNIIHTGVCFALPFLPLPVNLKHKKDLYYGGYGGVNFSFPGIQRSYAILDQAGTAIPGSKSYSRIFKNIGFQLGGIAYLKLTDHTAVSALPGIANYSFGYSIRNQWNDNNTLYTDNYLFTDRYWTIAFPIQFYYIFNPEQKVNFYVTCGAKYEFLFNAFKKVSFSESIMVNNQLKGSNGDTFKSRSNRMFKRSDFQTLAGMGISYQFTEFMVSLEVDLVKGWNQIIQKNNRYNDSRNLYTYPDIQDDMISNNLAFNIIVLYKLFKAPKKLKCKTP